MRLEAIIIEPLLTEKSNVMRERRKYVFKVDARANKIEIRQAVAQLSEKSFQYLLQLITAMI